MIDSPEWPVLHDNATTAIDLFAGAGGSSQGLSDAGFRVLAAVEQDKEAAGSLAANLPNVRVLEGDIRKMCPQEIQDRLGLANGSLTLLTACPPCQGFSSLGARHKGDERNGLVEEVWRFARVFRPASILIENVPGLARDWRWSELRAQLSSLGYEIGSWTVDAADFGVPQRRRRLIAIALRHGDIVFPNDLRELLPPWFNLTAPDARKVIAQAGSIKDSADSLHRARTPTPKVLERIQAIPTGGNHADLPAALQLDCHRRLRQQGRASATGPYGRILLQGPAPTMTTRCTTVSCGRFIHPVEDRGISLREAALLQTFPVDYRFVGSHESIERQIGNAVPVRLAHALGLAVRSLLADPKDDHSRLDLCHTDATMTVH